MIEVGTGLEKVVGTEKGAWILCSEGWISVKLGGCHFQGGL